MKGNFFLNHFPPPAYLSMPAVGFDMSDRSVKYVELHKQSGEILIKQFGNRAIPEGLIESGEIKQKDKLIEFLKTIKGEVKTEYIIIGLPEEKSFLSRVELPLMDEGEIQNALELQLEEHVPLSPSEAIFDFEIAKKDKKKKHIDINLIVYPRGLVEDYRDVFVGAGFTPLVFETESQSYIRAMVSKEDVAEEKVNMIIDFGKTRSTFAISKGSKLQFTSSVKVGGGDLERAIEKTLNVDSMEADKLKKEKGLINNKENEAVFDAMLPVVSSLKDEAIKYISYWNSHTKEHSRPEKSNISKILLCGGDSNLFGLIEYLSYKLNLPVEIGNPWTNIASFEDRIPEIDLRRSLFYATALGLALRAVQTNDD